MFAVRSAVGGVTRRTFTRAAVRPLTLAEPAALPEFPDPIVHYTAGISGAPPSAECERFIAGRAQDFTAQHMCGAAAQTAGAPASFFVLDLGHVDGKVDGWRRLLPDVDPFYAVKANPAPEMVSHLAGRGVGFDCASAAEIQLVLDQGVHPDRIIYAHPCKPPASLAFARDAGITRSVFDSVGELEKVARFAPGMSLLLRIWVDDSGAQCQLSNKFGATRAEWLPLLLAARRLGVRVEGVSLHVGSGTTDQNVFSRALRDALEVFGLAEANGHRMTTLDIGGGFPGTCTARSSLGQIAVSVRPVLDRFPPGTRFIAEPGRYFASEAQTLVSMVIGHRHPAGGKPTFFIADGLYGSFNCILYDHSEIMTAPLRPTGAATRPSAVFGQTCDGLDQIASDLQLPADLAVGDWLAFPGMGAYTNAACSRFNGFETPSLLVVE